MKMNKRSTPFIHLGKVIKLELVGQTEFTVTEIANLLQVSRQAISNLMNEKADVSPEMALRISMAFGGSPDIWLRLQAKYDLEKATKRISHFKLTPYQHTRA